MQRTAHAGCAPRVAHQRQSPDDGDAPNPHGRRWHRQREADSRQLHRRIRRASCVSGEGVSLDADPGHRRRPRVGPRPDSRQRGGRADCAGNDKRRQADRNRHLIPAAAVARQRRRSVDSDCTRVGIPGSARPDSSQRTRESLATRRRSKCSSRARSKSRGPSSKPIVSATSRWSESTPRSWRRSRLCRLDARAAAHHPSARGQEIFALAAPPGLEKSWTPATVRSRRRACLRVRPDTRHGRDGWPCVHRLGRPRGTQVLSRASAMSPGAAQRVSFASTVRARSLRPRPEGQGCARSKWADLPWSRRSRLPSPRSQTPSASRGQPEALSNGGVRVRRGVHHAGAQLRRAFSGIRRSATGPTTSRTSRRCYSSA